MYVKVAHLCVWVLVSILERFMGCPLVGSLFFVSHEERRGYSHLKEEALDRTMWRNRFGGGFEPVVRQNTE
jgi:hypothetical protein